MNMATRILALTLFALLSSQALALEFTRLFAAGAPSPGEASEEGEVFQTTTPVVYIRFAYTGGQAGQQIHAYWVLEKDVQGRSGEFATDQVRLEKASDLGQFSFGPEEAWSPGEYRVVLTDSDNNILAEQPFRIAQAAHLATAAKPAPRKYVPGQKPALATHPGDSMPTMEPAQPRPTAQAHAPAQIAAPAPDPVDQQQNSSDLAEIAARHAVEKTPISSVPTATVPTVTDLSFAGPDRKGGKPGKASTKFKSNTPVIALRLHYANAQAGTRLRAVWEHTAGSNAKGKVAPAGTGLFAITELALQTTPEGDAHFAYQPALQEQKSATSHYWLPGRYRVTLVASGAQSTVLGSQEFTITQARPAPKKVVKKTKAQAKLKAKPKPKKVTRTIAPKVLEATLAKSIESAQPKEPTSEFTNVWRRLLLWTRIDGGNKGGTITARWYTGKTGGVKQSEKRQAIGPGENWVVFWLHLKNPEAMLPKGPARVELYWGKKRLKTIHYEVKQAGFFDGLSDSFQQMGNEMQWLMDQQLSD